MSEIEQLQTEIEKGQTNRCLKFHSILCRFTLLSYYILLENCWHLNLGQSLFLTNLLKTLSFIDDISYSKIGSFILSRINGQ
jgi:hypothetical protein